MLDTFEKKTAFLSGYMTFITENLLFSPLPNTKN